MAARRHAESVVVYVVEGTGRLTARDLYEASGIGMSGREAVDAIKDAAQREELLAIELVARALASSRKKVLRDWQRRNLPLTRVGRDVSLSSALVLSVYFPHLNHSGN